MLADLLAAVVVILMAIGTVFVFSASANVAEDIDLQKFYESTALRQLLFFPLAILFLYLGSRINYRRLSLQTSWQKSPAVYLLAFSAVLLILVLAQRITPFLPGLIPMVNRHYRWFRIPLGFMTISFQPSELAKWVTIIFIAALCDKYADTLHLFKKRFVPICTIIAFIAGLIVIEDLGTAAFISLLGFLILGIAGARWRHLLAPVPVAAAAFILILFIFPHRMQRITSFLRPTDLADSANYQANQSLIAIGSGGIFGKGIGKGICKYGHLPEDTTDFIFAVIGEELGFVGTATVILLFIFFVWLGIHIIQRCTERFGKLLATAIVLAVGIQAAINIGVVTVVLPTKGIPLPFVSAGGTSMLLSAAAVGLLLNIAKQSSHQPDQTAIAELQNESALAPKIFADTAGTGQNLISQTQEDNQCQKDTFISPEAEQEDIYTRL